MGVFSFARIDGYLLGVVLLLAGAGLSTTRSFVGESLFFERQVIWLSLGLAIFFILSLVDFHFLRKTGVIVTIYLGCLSLLALLLIIGGEIKGAQRWLSIGAFSLQPSDPAKLAVILILAKYFSRRHIEIAHVRHILVSGFYAFVPFVLVFIQPDFGSSFLFFTLWLGMVLVSGISKKHLAGVFIMGAVVSVTLWTFVLAEYQRARIVNFLHPLTDIQGTGYNVYQSVIAVGSGEIMGKGVGYGTQSRLSFLPEYETDFIFAAFAEEWGFVGSVALFGLFGVVVWRIVTHALRGATNFEMLFGAGLAIFFVSHFLVHVGMNIGVLPVTGTPLPFVSYGGSHLLTEFAGLGILMGMQTYRRSSYRERGVEEGNQV